MEISMQRSKMGITKLTLFLIIALFCLCIPEDILPIVHSQGQGQHMWANGRDNYHGGSGVNEHRNIGGHVNGGRGTNGGQSAVPANGGTNNQGGAGVIPVYAAGAGNSRRNNYHHSGGSCNYIGAGPVTFTITILAYLLQYICGNWNV